LYINLRFAPLFTSLFVFLLLFCSLS
jgi:hypothetical protein